VNEISVGIQVYIPQHVANLPACMYRTSKCFCGSIDIRGGNGLETALTSGLNPRFGHVMDSPGRRASAANANTNMSSGVVRSALDSVLENYQI